MSRVKPGRESCPADIGSPDLQTEELESSASDPLHHDLAPLVLEVDVNIRRLLALLRSGNVLPSPVHVVSAGDLRENLLRAGRGERWASIPAFTRTVRGVRVEIGMIRRQCTKDYKIVPIRREVGVKTDRF